MLQPDFSMFDMCVCLNHPDAKKRWDDCVIEFNRIGLKGVSQFHALPDIGPHQSFNNSVRAILKTFFLSDRQHLLFMEDDVMFRNEAVINAALKQLPDDWDILYFGVHVRGDKPVRYSENLFRIFGGWTTHCIAFRKRIVEHVIIHQPDASAQMFDNWLSDQLPKFNAYCISPIVATQRPGNSLIWGNSVDYTDIFATSEKLLT